MEISTDGILNAQLSHSLIYNKVYKQYAELVVTVVVPWLTLAGLNTRIYLAVRAST